MTESETIYFDILGYGKFTLDGEGLAKIISNELVQTSETTQALIEDFNLKNASNHHLTPLEALGKIPSHFYVTEDAIQNVEINNLEGVSEPTDEIIF